MPYTFNPLSGNFDYYEPSTGTPGPAGAAATINVGAVTTGAPGSSASVTNTGTSSAAVFAFTIPRGDTGPAGATGATGATGAAGSAATVSVGSVTTGAAGSSASVTNTGTSGAAVFAFTIPRGDTGATGAQGPAGPATTDASALTTGTLAEARLPSSGVTAGSYGSSSLVPVVTVDATGRVTAVSTAAVSGGGGGTSAGANLYLNANFI